MRTFGASFKGAQNLSNTSTFREHVWCFQVPKFTYADQYQAVRVLAVINLVPRSLVDEAEGEIWQSKKISFSWLAAPFDSCPISSLKIYAVFRGKLSSNSSSNLKISAVGENEKAIRKDERRKDLEVICHSGLNNFCNMIVPLPKSQTRHPARAQADPSIFHTCFFDTKLYKPLPLFAIFFALTRSPNLCTKTACRELIPEAF